MVFGKGWLVGVLLCFGERVVGWRKGEGGRGQRWTVYIELAAVQSSISQSVTPQTQSLGQPQELPEGPPPVSRFWGQGRAGTATRYIR